MRKTVIASLGVLIASALGVIAQSGDPITQRQNLMKNNQEQIRALTGMARGQAPFNAATAQAAFQQLEQNAQQTPPLFPAGSTQGKTAALPAIWERKADFDARAVKLQQDARAARAAITDQASLQAAIQRVGQNCGGCHETYRRKDT
ncbi:cytochrome c [Microvirga sp. CF3062]|uniref:c-type cytochrome n=1 Tax=Microvirga sp. CF3062 TaxID=3110182 RepID=UPI002E769840|nr:cytochrome c [Microvirga sp. CF3062]MEE1656913.1 cytochrome c [Microvirga sp. CF3062]